MAATLMQPPVHRPSMDHHSSSFDHPRSASAPFASASYDRAPSPGAPPALPRSRTSSSSSASPITTPTGAAAAYPQYGNHYPQFGPPQPAWPSSAGLPANSFYAPPYPSYPRGGGGGPGAYQQGYQQQQPDFSAWAHVYQHMVGSGQIPQQHGGPGPMQQVAHQQQQQYQSSQREELDYADESPRRRTNSGSIYPGDRPSSGQSTSSPKSAQPPQPFHPYKRGPAQQRGMPRSASQPSSALNEIIRNSNANSSRSVSSPVEDHRRTSSADSALRAGTPPDLAAPPRIRTAGERRNSGSSNTSSRSGTISPAARTASPLHVDAARPTSAASSAKSAPLTSGSIAANAANAARPSPLSQAQAAAPAPPAKKVPFKSRFKTSSAPDKDLPPKKKKEAKQAATPTPVVVEAPAPVPTRAEASSTSRALPASTGNVPLAPPSAPFVNARAMGSDVSLAETERTAATNATGKSKRSLFRIRKNSDNISLSSTVSSASMMIRKMGSLGKLARRNSLMGISKIFKDKPKDEDAPIPEKQGMLSFKKKSGHKADLAPTTLSPAHVERVSEDDDRVLDGLSPAAQLARQHTVRSKAEAAKREAEAKRRSTVSDFAGPTGEPTWDTNTVNRNNQIQAAAADAARPSFDGANVVRVVPRSPDVVRHAFAVNHPDYDSDDSSDCDDTMDDITVGMNRAHINDAADVEFQAMWGKADIDRNARPKKGILRVVQSNEDLEQLAIRQSATPTRDSTPVGRPHLSDDLPGAHNDIDGVPHAVHHESPLDSQYDPLSPNFSPFDSKPFELSLEPATYEQPARNTSAPALPKLAQAAPPTARSMTAPSSRRRLIWAPECAVYSTYDAVTYDRRSEPATCNRLTPELAMAIKQELNAFKLEMPVHPSSRTNTHYFA